MFVLDTLRLRSLTRKGSEVQILYRAPSFFLVMRRRVPDREMLFLSRVLGVKLEDLFPRNVTLSKVGPQFQSGERLAVFPTRAELLDS